ncbi:MAG: chorismate mutase [Sciscionella sp.]
MNATAPKDDTTRSQAAANAAATPPQDITTLREEIDWLDAEILRLVKRRVEVSKTIGSIRMAGGGTRIVVSREMDVLNRYRELGPEGRALAMALLNLGRGRLGR